MATLAGVSWRAADALASGRQGRPVRRISHTTAAALLNVQPQHAESLRRCHVPAAEPRTRLLRLLGAGMSVSALVEQLGVVRSVLDDLADGSLLWCPGLLALRLVVLTRSRATTVPASPGPADQRPALAGVAA